MAIVKLKVNSITYKIHANSLTDKLIELMKKQKDNKDLDLYDEITECKLNCVCEEREIVIAKMEERKKNGFMSWGLTQYPFLKYELENDDHFLL